MPIRRQSITAPLTDKESLFVAEYLRTLNPQQAAAAAGYADATGQHAAQILRRPAVAAAVEQAKTARVKRLEVSQDRVLQELARLSFADIRGIFTEDGHLKLPRDLDDDTAASVASIEVVERPTFDEVGRRSVEYVHKVRLVDKTPALALLCRHLGMLNDKLSLDARVQKAHETAPDHELLDRVKTLLLRAGTLPPVLEATSGEPIPSADEASS